jgi:5-methylcytosine-specific restriction endonuclease McrA
MKPGNCKHCGSDKHTSLMCFLKPRRRLKPIRDSTKLKEQQTKREWFVLNPPNEKGLWFCYLGISPICPNWLTRSTITLEHVKSKARHPELKFVVTNLKPACSFCNAIKGSRDIDEL